jgi:hypothetical protein
MSTLFFTEMSIALFGSVEVMNSQRLWNEQPVPHVAPGSMTQVVAQASYFNTFHISVCYAQLWLVLLKMCSH